MYLQQGDVILKPATIPKKMNKINTNVLQFGESTGHAHRLFGEDFTVYQEPETNVKYLRLVKPTALRHEEHKEIEVPAGDYRIDIVREYDHFKEEARQVVD